MFRFVRCCGAAAVVLGLTCPARAAPPPEGVLYELIINGERFTVEGSRMVKLTSATHPGTTYQVAVRESPVQRVRLETLEFDYVRPATVEPHGSHAVMLRQELGFTVLVTDLGPAPDAQGQETLLQKLTDSARDTFQGLHGEKIEVGQPHTHRFAVLTGRGNTVRYQDQQGLGHTCLIYVLSGEKCGASFVAQYVDHDADDVLPLLRRLLDSMRPLARH